MYIALFLDFNEPMDREDLFRKIAESREKKLNIPCDVIYKNLKERESEGSTAISPFTAVPHIIVEGMNHFSLAVARNRKGINFSPY